MSELRGRKRPVSDGGMAMPEEKVLIVDDEIEFTEVLSTRMESRGMAVDTAASGHEALEKAKNKSYDAIILDLSMPEMDGMETLKHLLSENPDLQVIVLTGYASIEKGVEAIKLGAMEFLKKPAELQELVQQIQRAKDKKMVLVEKRIEEKMRDILQRKSW
jgi:DNA-binding NtrC family response regulator